ncbi:LOW QUALITY PROTEIN: epoxide hydrolase 3 [Dasypus novemcinctus]|uniref:LOW QUALITY PROTEIN: epoxide hydrolase 3 n=1 Tax=Dasypus novemcinctus TaxID=9361 RepID=UPI0026605796|nr:LOW QUALITY PROTEIN: epoxide hydrolase 3 [Dasypus novemcinctus]
MPELAVTALLAPSRLTLKLLRAVLWSLVFSAALLAAAVYGCVALAHVLCRPRRGCCGRPRRAAPACLSDPALGQHGFLGLQTSGLRLHYVSAGRGNGPLMLFLHGFPETWFCWRYQLREFQSRFHVVALDMRGYGPSDAPREVDCYTVDLLMADIQDVILGLGYSKCILVGHDWGGLLAWNFSIYYPSLVERLVVSSAAPMSVYQGHTLCTWSSPTQGTPLCGTALLARGSTVHGPAHDRGQEARVIKPWTPPYGRQMLYQLRHICFLEQHFLSTYSNKAVTCHQPSGLMQALFIPPWDVLGLQTHVESEVWDPHPR